MTTIDQNADINSNEAQLRTLTNLVTNDYLSGSPDDEPDLAADERFARFVLSVGDNPAEAVAEYFADKQVDPEVHQFLAQHGPHATFGDLAAFLDQ